jgi:hypothetical protein
LPPSPSFKPAQTSHSGAITIESYTLAADVAMLITVVSPTQMPFTLAFQRQ